MIVLARGRLLRCGHHLPITQTTVKRIMLLKARKPKMNPSPAEMIVLVRGRGRGGGSSRWSHRSFPRSRSHELARRGSIILFSV
jgi:hypothetical protein